MTDWNAPGGSPLLIETQAWQFADNGESITLDVFWTLRATQDLRFGEHSYGGLFLRMPWRKETGGDVLTSEGHNTASTAEGQRARWIALSMRIPTRDKGPVGVAFFDHPKNPEYPNPWRVDDNLGIVPSRCIAGEWQLPQGDVSTNRYRLVAFIGAMDRAAIEAEGRKFT